MNQICSDTFLVNVIGNLICTVRLKSRGSIQAVYGMTAIMKGFLYTPGTGVNASHANFGFSAEYTPAAFPPGVSLVGSFTPNTPDISGNLTDPREATYNGLLTVGATYLGGDMSITVKVNFNPGV